jgi:PAS domain S-box-containing protein
MRALCSILGLALVYLVAAKLGLQLALVNKYATAVWPPTGIALAALLIGGYRLWPGVLIGAFVANVTTGETLSVSAVLASLGIAMGNTLEAVLGAYLVNRFAGGRRAFDRAADVFRFAAVAGLASTAVSATVGVSTLLIAGLAHWMDSPAIWLTWWVGDAGGNLVFAPLLLLWAADFRWECTSSRLVEAGLLLLTAYGLALAAFAMPLPTMPAHLGLAFLCTPPLLWAAFRFGSRETSAVLVVICGVAIWGWMRGVLGGVFSASGSLLEVQAYCGVTSVTMLAVAAEVAQRRKHQDLLASHADELRSQEARLQSILDNSTTVVYLKDLQGRYLLVNRQYERLFHVKREDVIGKTDYDLFSRKHADAFAANDRRVLDALGPVEFEEIAPHDDGDHTYISIKFPLRDAAGEIYGVCGISTDITERKGLEEKLRETAKLESLGVLAGGIAHDFNNLLTGILGGASLLREVIVSPSPNASIVETIVQSSERAAQLTTQMLTYAGRAPRLIEPVNLSSEVRSIAPLVSAAIPKNVTVEITAPENLPLIAADPGQLQQVIMNLIINAAEATQPAGGVVEVSASLCEFAGQPVNEHVALDKPRPGAHISLAVRDNGCGMDEVTRARIFDPFFTTKFAGRGLGLAAVQGIVRGHNGTIRVESSPGSGSTFTVFFPVTRIAAAPSGAPTPASANGTGLILVVDDEPVICRTAKAALELYGYSVLVAGNGQEAVAAVERYADPIRLIILDMTMPVLSGDEALKRIRLLRPALPVIASSGYAESEARTKFGHGIVGFLQKPYTARALIQKVHAALESQQVRPAQ